MDGAVAYLVSRFPKLTETFILFEMNALESLGVRLELFPLIHHQEGVVHPEAETWVQRAHYRNWYDPRLALSLLYWLIRAPFKTLGLWFRVFSAYRLKPKYLLRSMLTLWLGFDFARQMARLGIVHIHAHWATYPATAAYLIHQLTGIPYSLTAHAHDIYVDQTMLGEKIRSAAFVVTISEHNRRYLIQQFGSDEKIQLLHCGVDTNQFIPPESRENETFKIICIGALEEKKGHHYLVEALKEVLDRGISFRCLLVGEGPLRETLNHQIREARLEGQVVLLGGLPRSKIIELLKGVDVMVLPSVRLESGKQEGIPVALMEGMAMELPVIATRISGVPELVEDGVNGLLVPEKDPAALAAAILAVYQDPESRRRFGINARKVVLADFNLHKSAQVLYSLIQQAADARTPLTQDQNIFTQDTSPEAEYGG